MTELVVPLRPSITCGSGRARGGFGQVDPLRAIQELLRESLQAYIYVRSGPVGATDPLGLMTGGDSKECCGNQKYSGSSSGSYTKDWSEGEPEDPKDDDKADIGKREHNLRGHSGDPLIRSVKTGVQGKEGKANAAQAGLEALKAAISHYQLSANEQSEAMDKARKNAKKDCQEKCEKFECEGTFQSCKPTVTGWFTDSKSTVTKSKGPEMKRKSGYSSSGPLGFKVTYTAWYDWNCSCS